MNKKRVVPDFFLEQLILGELPPEKEAEVLRDLEAEPGGMDRLVRLRASNQDIIGTYPPEKTAAEINRRLDLTRSKIQRRPARTRAWVLAPALAAAAAILFLVILPLERGPEVNLQTTRVKGGPGLTIYRKVPQGVEELGRGSRVWPGDVLQVSYRAAGSADGVIISVDGRGAVTLHFPASPADSTALNGKGAQALPRAYELDDAPDFERFFFVTSDQPIEIETVLAAGRALGAEVKNALVLPDGLHQFDFLLSKSSSQEGKP
jgi:anti-sigma factor RsiW